MSSCAGDNMADPVDPESQPLFAAAFREHHASLLQYLRRRVRSDADARDIAQEAYLRLLRYRENQDLRSLKAILFRIATNLAGMRERVARSQSWAEHRHLDDPTLTLPSAPSHEEHLMGQEELGQLQEAIQSLPTKCQQIFVLSRFHEMTNHEIAAHCGISVKMVQKQLLKALKICRARVGSDRG